MNMEDKRRIFEALKARAIKAREMQNGGQMKQMHRLTREQMMELFKNKIKKSE